MSLGKWFAHLWASIKHIFESVDAEIKKLYPVVGAILQALKTIEDNGVADFFAKELDAILLKSSLAEEVNAKIKEWLPKIIIEWDIMGTTANITDPLARAAEIIKHIKFASDSLRDQAWHGLASKLLEILADGKITWSEAVATMEWFFTTYIQPAPQQPPQ